MAALAFGGAGLAAAKPAKSQPPLQTQPIVLEHVRVIDGRGGPPLEDASILIQNGRIVAVGALSPPAAARVIDLSGRTIMPGLISDHSHVGLVDGVTVAPDHYNRANILRQLGQYEAYGVTTVRRWA